METNKEKSSSKVHVFIEKLFSKPILKVVVIGVVGLVLIYILSDITTPSDSINIEKPVSSTSTYSYRYMTTIEYTKYLEEKLAGVVSDIYGISGVSVMVSVVGSTKYDYLTSSEQSSDIVYVGKDSEKYPIVVSEDLPKCRSVMIVAKGVTPKSKVDIIRSVSSLLDLSMDQVYVIEG